jgi:hypothetical protein
MAMVIFSPVLGAPRGYTRVPVPSYFNARFVVPGNTRLYGGDDGQSLTRLPGSFVSWYAPSGIGSPGLLYARSEFCLELCYAEIKESIVAIQNVSDAAVCTR